MQHWFLKNTDLINSLENIIQYSFKDKKKLITAVTHSSYAYEKNSETMENNERLEFLGDTVLSTVISERLYREKNLLEGDMTKIRAHIVCETSLAECAMKINLGDFILLGKGEQMSGGKERHSILSDAFEALVGAIYIDGGLEKARVFINNSIDFIYRKVMEGTYFLDYKTKFQEIVQSEGSHDISYEIVHESGPDHNKEYISQISIDGNVVGRGKGKTKKEAEQSAAKKAMENTRWAT